MLDTAKRLLLEHPNLADVGVPQSEAEIDVAAKSLGVTFPDSFRAYLRIWGRVSFGPNQYHGLGTNTLNVVTTTERVRRERGLPKHFVVVCDHEGDEYVCLNTSVMSAGECPVVIWDSPSRLVSRPRAPNFEMFLESDILDFLA